MLTKKLLYAENCQIFRTFIKVLLNREFPNLKIYPVEDGISAVKMHRDCFYSKNPYELFLTENKMPDMYSLTAVQKIREIDSEIPIIMLSSTGHPKFKQRALNSGINDYVEKDSSLDALIPIVKKYIK